MLYHPLVKARAKHSDKWKFNNTNHGLRDRFSHRYAHRHSYNDVFEWFENAGFSILDVMSPAVYRQLFKRRAWGVGVTGRKRDRLQPADAPRRAADQLLEPVPTLAHP
jgi:hypothetical protein